jgi:hypothetical protein
MARHHYRSSTVARQRERAADHPRQRERVSALSGHVDYLELAERVGQGVSVAKEPHVRHHKPRKP